LTQVNDNFRIIILVDKRFIRKVDSAFLNRLEKMKITFNALLDEDNKKFAENIIKEINLENDNIINSKTNYNLKNLLINCGKEEIEGMVYNFTYKFKKNKPGPKK